MACVFFCSSAKPALCLIPDIPPHFVCEFALQKINNDFSRGIIVRAAFALKLPFGLTFWVNYTAE